MAPAAGAALPSKAAAGAPPTVPPVGRGWGWCGTFPHGAASGWPHGGICQSGHKWLELLLCTESLWPQAKSSPAPLRPGQGWVCNRTEKPLLGMGPPLPRHLCQGSAGTSLNRHRREPVRQGEMGSLGVGRTRLAVGRGIWPCGLPRSAGQSHVCGGAPLGTCPGHYSPPAPSLHGIPRASGKSLLRRESSSEGGEQPLGPRGLPASLRPGTRLLAELLPREGASATPPALTKLTVHAHRHTPGA